MTRHSVITCIAAMVIAGASPANAGIFDIANKYISSFSLSRDVDAMIEYVDMADATFNKSIDYLFSVLATEEDRMKIEAELKAANEIQDPKEKESKIKEIEIEKEAAVKKAVNKSDCQKKVNALSSREKALYANAASNVWLSVVYNMYAVQQGQIISQKCSSSPPACSGIALKMNRVADIVRTVPKKTDNLTRFFGTLYKIGRAANIDIQKPTSEKDKPKEVEI